MFLDSGCKAEKGVWALMARPTGIDLLVRGCREAYWGDDHEIQSGPNTLSPLEAIHNSIDHDSACGKLGTWDKNKTQLNLKRTKNARLVNKTSSETPQANTTMDHHARHLFRVWWPPQTRISAIIIFVSISWSWIYQWFHLISRLNLKLIPNLQEP